MLMAAVTSTSLGTDTTSTRAMASGHTEGTAMSFVDSLVENAAHAGVTAFDVGGHTKPMSVGESDGPTSAKTASATLSASDSEVRAARSPVDMLQNLAPKPESSGSLEIGRATGLVANKTTPRVTGAASLRDAKLSGMNAASQPTVSDDTAAPVTPRSEISQGQKLATNATDGGVQDGTDGTTEPDPQIAAQIAIPAMDNAVKQGSTGKSASLISGKSQDGSTGGAIKDRGTSVKAEKGTKAEAKQDKKDKAGVAVIAAGVEVQATVLPQVFVNSAAGQQSVTGEAEAEVSSATSAVASSQSPGIAGTANAKNSKAVANASKSDENNVKSAGSSSTGNPLSQKTDADVAKPELVTVVSPDADKSKQQSSVASVAESAQLHAVSVAPGSASGSAPGGGLTHNGGAGLHTTEAVSHAVAAAQTGTNVIDTSGPVDVTHKTLTATPTSLEVGVSNGTHGWLKIRAEMADGGSVNTSLSTSSPAGQEMLHRELPSLAAFLKSEHVAVNAVVVQPMPTSGPDARGPFAGTGGREHGQAQQSGSQGRDGRQNQSNPNPAHAGTSVPYSGPGAVGEDEIFSSISYAQGGGWLSVRA